MDSQETDNTTVEKINIENAVEMYGAGLLRLCFMYLKDRSLAEDALQDTFLKAYRWGAGFDGRSSEKTWLTKIAMNVCKDYLRKSWFKNVNMSYELADIPYKENFEDIAQKDYLILTISTLPPRYREIILLFYYQELKVNEISDVLGIPIGTVSSRMNRARLILKEKLKGWYFDE